MKLTTVDRIALGTITTRTESGRHFAEIWPDSWLTRMETAGYLTVSRPVHDQTDLPYSREYWHVEVAAEVPDWFAGGVLIGSEDLYDESGEYSGDIVEQVEALEAVRRGRPAIAPETDSIPQAAVDAYWTYVQEQDDDYSARCADALFEASEQRAEDLDQLGLDPYSRRACEPGARRGLLR